MRSKFYTFVVVLHIDLTDCLGALTNPSKLRVSPYNEKLDLEYPSTLSNQLSTLLRHFS